MNTQKFLKMNLSKISTSFGLGFIVVGILGFFPRVTAEGYLFGLFHINSANNFIFLLSGLGALVCVRIGENACRKYFKFFGIFYGVIALMGLIVGDNYILGILANNFNDIWLHTFIAGIFLYLGYTYGETPTLF